MYIYIYNLPEAVQIKGITCGISHITPKMEIPSTLHMRYTADTKIFVVTQPQKLNHRIISMMKN